MKGEGGCGLYGEAVALFRLEDETVVPLWTRLLGVGMREGWQADGQASSFWMVAYFPELCLLSARWSA